MFISIPIKKTLISSLFLLLIISLCANLSFAQEGTEEPSVEIYSLSGYVSILSRDAKAWVQATTGMALESGSRIRTGENSHAALAFNPGKTNIVSVRSNSHVVVQLKDNDKLMLVDGTLYSSIQDLAEGSSFEIKTPLATCGVRGTKYTVTYEALSMLTTLAVVENSVVLDSIMDPDKFVSVKELEARELGPWNKIYIDATGTGFSTDLPVEETIKVVTEDEYLRTYTPEGLINARRAAVVDAHRNLAAKIYGTVIDSKTVLGSYADKDEKVKVTVSGIVQGAQETGTVYYSDGSVQVTMEIQGVKLKESLMPLTGDIFDQTCITGVSVLTPQDAKDFEESLL
jgi:hypothetical protein